MKRILAIGVYKRGEPTSETVDLENVSADVPGDRAVFTGHATVKGRFKGEDFSGFYRLSKLYEKQREHRQVVASRATR